MWIVTGPFDSETSNEVGFQKSKLLKSGKSYLIGRKSTCDLVVNHKKISHDHGQFLVGGFSPDDVTNTDYTPTLRILNSKNKTMRILREGVINGVIVNPGATEALQHDDQVDVVSGLPLTVQWQRICCFETPGKVRSPIPLDGCASLGIHVVRTLHPDITHHLVPSYALTPTHMTSLLAAAHLVKPEWLSELLSLSTLDPRESARALEHTFILPPESKFRPAFTAALPPALKTFKTWEPNETRLNMLKGYRFVFAGEKGLEIPAGYRDLVKRGGAEYEAFTASTGAVRWRKALVRAKKLAEEKNGKVVSVADGSAMELAVGVEEWEEMVSVTKSLELELIQPEKILQAVASVDTFFVDSARPGNSQGQDPQETPLPDVVPNTLSGEPSIAPPFHGSHRATSPTSGQPPPAVAPPSEASAPELEIAEVPIPRRLPPRRAAERSRTAPSPSPGPADDAMLVDAPPGPGPPPILIPSDAVPTTTQLPTPVSQTHRLPPRRRANQGIDAASALIASSSNPQDVQSQFSQLDRYKALFDASNPDHVPSSETHPGTEASTAAARTAALSAVPEETESQIQSGDLRGTKRGRGAGDSDDVETMGSATNVAATSADTLEGAHRAKRRALDANADPQPTIGAPASASQRILQTQQRQGPGTTTAMVATTTTTTTTTTPAGAAEVKHATKRPSSKLSSNKLDTDENFLRAVNSTKRGKKLEDDFDREFNLLKIAKPKKAGAVVVGTAAANGSAGAPEAAAAVAPWDAIDDFGDVGIRGNFMVVVEMDIQRGSAKPASAALTNTNDAAHPEWIGRPNFKKFKTKRTAADIERKQTIELVLSEEHDYGIGNAYWRSAASRSQSRSDIREITAAHPPPLHSTKSKPKPPSSKASRASANKSRGGRARAPASEDEDEPEDEEAVVESLDMDDNADEMELDADLVPLKSAPSTRSKAGAKAKAPAASTKLASKTTAAKRKTTAKAKTSSSPARTKKAAPAAAPSTRGGRTTRRRNPPALFLPSDEDEDEGEVEMGGGSGEIDEIDEIEEEDESESAVGVSMQLGAGKEEEEVVVRGTGTSTGTSGLGDRASAADAGMTSTLRSTAGTQLRREAVRATAKRRAVALAADDDDSDDAVFKGFGGRKRGRVR